MAKFGRLWGVEITLVFILTLLPFLFFWRLITPYPVDQMVIAHGDFAEQYFPLRAFVAQQWVRYEIPLWNPYLYGGQPALADIQSGALYPIHVAQALILGWIPPLFGTQVGFPLKALAWQMILHFSLTAAGTYLFARHLFLRNGHPLRRARFGAVIASLTFTYSGYLTGFPVQQLAILEVSAWLPWVLWGLNATISSINRSRTLPKVRGGEDARRQNTLASSRPRLLRQKLGQTALQPAILTAMAFALSILAGHPQTVMYIVYLTLAYTLVQLAMNSEQGTSVIPKPVDGAQRATGNRWVVTQNWLYLAYWSLIVLFGVALAAAQILPTLEFIRYSVRAELTYQAVSAGLPLSELVALVYPGFFGGSPEYVGIAALVLIALALMLAYPRWEVYFWAGSGLVSLLLAFGGNLFVYPLFYLFAPGFDAVRQQERVFFIFSFSAAVLAGFGAMVLVTPLPRIARQRYAMFEKRLRQVVVVAAMLTVLFIYGSAAATARGDAVNLFYGVLWHHIFGLIILLGMLALLALRQRRWLRRWWAMALVAAWLAFNLFSVNWRFNLEAPSNPPPFVPNGVTQFLQGNLEESPGRVASGGYLPGGNSAASVHNLQDITGNTPLHLANVDTFLQKMPAWRLWQLLNVRYVVDQRDIADDGLRLVLTEDDLMVFEMGDPFSRAWLVAETEVVEDNNQTIARLSAADVDLRRKAIVPNPLATPLADPLQSSVTVTDFGATNLRLQLDATAQHLLVISQIFYPGWSAAIDGHPVALLRVNSVLQGVIVPPGQHEVTLMFWPAVFQWGSLISGAALIVGGVLLWLSWPKAVEQN